MLRVPLDRHPGPGAGGVGFGVVGGVVPAGGLVTSAGGVVTDSVGFGVGSVTSGAFPVV